jgi:peptidoglycan/LPS O-acetylase OafA/YrhL
VRWNLGYRPALDGLRAVAVALVVGLHAGDRTFASPLPGGHVGVDVFFVLSGFLITALLVAERRDRGRIHLGEFWLRRLRRLAPALVLMLAAFTALKLVLPSAEPRALNLQRAGWALSYLANWVRAVDGLDLGPLAHTWSLAIEEQFYLLWPLLLAGLLAVANSPRRAASAAFVAAVAASCWRAWRADSDPVSWLYNALDMRADALLYGAALGLAAHVPAWRDSVAVRRWTSLLGSLALVSLLLIAWLDPWPQRQHFRYGQTLVAWGSAALIWTLVFPAPQAVLPRLLARPALVRVGKLSYGIYLWHLPTFWLVRKAWPGPVGWTWLAASTVASVAFAAASDRWWERRFRLPRPAAPTLAPAFAA